MGQVYYKLSKSIIENICDRYVAGENMVSLGKEFGVHPSAVHGYLVRRNIPRRSASEARKLAHLEHGNIRKIRFTKEQIEDIKARYIAGTIPSEIGKCYNVSRATINRLLDAQNIPKRSIAEAHRIYTCNHKFFKTIDSEEKAYWLGFISADGCISDKNELIIGLSGKDIKHLETFKKYLGSAHPLKQYMSKYDTPMVSISIGSKELCTDLSVYGVVPRKTHILKFPKLSDKLIHHYMRGYVDGDGGFALTSSKYKPSLRFYAASNEQFLLEFQKFLIENCNVKQTKLGSFKNTATKVLHYGGTRQVLRIAEFLYKDSTVYLRRKKNVVNRIIKRINKGKV